MVITTPFSASSPSLSCLFPPQIAPGYIPLFFLDELPSELWLALKNTRGPRKKVWLGSGRVLTFTEYPRDPEMLGTLATFIQVVEFHLVYSSA